jgi:hypothetical protein
VIRKILRRLFPPRRPVDVRAPSLLIQQEIHAADYRRARARGDDKGAGKAANRARGVVHEILARGRG